MRTPEQVLEMARARYKKSWRTWISEGTARGFSFSLSAPSAQVIARESDAVGSWAREWWSWARVHPSARLRTVTRQTLVGAQEVFTHLELATVEDLVTLDNQLSGHWRKANERWNLIQAMPGGSVERLHVWLSRIVELDDADFAILLNATTWFRNNPCSGYMVRQVPVRGMHTKWLARHRSLVLACLDLKDSAAPGSHDLDAGELEQSDLDVLGLKALPVHVDLILADPDDRLRLGGLRHVRAPLPEISELNLKPENVLIVENKESAYIVPDWNGTVVIHSLGNHLNVLAEIKWLDGARHLYWGDLDRAGFALLSRARVHLPHIVSVLMDSETLRHHHELCVIDTTRADSPEPNLSGKELAALDALTAPTAPHLRLEQERVAEHFILERLNSALMS